MKKTSEDLRLEMEEAKKDVKELSDSELDQAAGGWFPILDRCIQGWEPSICTYVSPITNRYCPNLEAIRAEEIQKQWYKVYRCKKGYFSEEIAHLY